MLGLALLLVAHPYVQATHGSGLLEFAEPAQQVHGTPVEAFQWRVLLLEPHDDAAAELMHMLDACEVAEAALGQQAVAATDAECLSDSPLPLPLAELRRR